MSNCCRDRREGGGRWSRWALLAVLLGAPMSALADRIEIRGQIVDAQYQPIAHRSLRLVLASDEDPRAPQAGRTVVSDADGRFTLTVDQTPRRHWVFGGSLGMVIPFPARASDLGLGIEVERFGRTRLEWLHIDWLGGGAVTLTDAFAQGPDGRFDIAYRSNMRAGDYFEDRPDQRFTGLAAALVPENIERHPRVEGGFLWTMDLMVIPPAPPDRSP